MSHRFRGIRVPRGLAALLIVLTIVPLSPKADAVGYTEAEVTDVAIHITLGHGLTPGDIWHVAAGMHVREREWELTVSGDLIGSGTFRENAFHEGPCDGETCQGRLDRIGEIVIDTETERWTGAIAVTQGSDRIVSARSVLMERASGESQAMLLDAASLADDGALRLSGRKVTLNGPTAGVSFSQSMCVTGDTTAHGGFLASKPADDAGPARIRFDALGNGGELGMHGDGRQVGRVGLFYTEFVAARRADYLLGEFVLAGASGAYRDLVGFGIVRATMTEEPRCDSGHEFIANWIGVAQITFDPTLVLPPQVRFTSPQDNTTVENPIQIAADIWHVTLEPAGAAREGFGHLHLIVDAPCVAPGEVIPNSELHIHLDSGANTTEISLPAGHHRLCIQVGNGEHVATAATDVVNIFVTPPPTDGGNFGN